MTKWLTIIIATLFGAHVLPSQTDTGIPMVRVMQRVDTTDPDIRAVLYAWVDSLDQWRGVGPQIMGGRPDRPNMATSVQSIVRNWFSQRLDVIRTFPPTILSIEREKASWTVRTLFSTVDRSSGHIIPLGILRTMFTRTATGDLKTVPSFPASVQSWPQARVKNLTVVHAPGMHIDTARAEASVHFIRRTAQQFDVEEPSNVMMVLARDRDEMCLLLGVEYYAFPPSGLAYPEQQVILSALGDPYYPHELVHIVLRDLDAHADPILREGVATWLGGSISKDYIVLVREYLQSTELRAIPSFIKLFTEDILDQQDQYILGAVIVDAAYRRHGTEAVVRLLKARSKSETMLLVSRYLDIDVADSQGSLVPFLEEALEWHGVKPGK